MTNQPTLSTPVPNPTTLTAALLREFSGSKSTLGKILCAAALRQWLAGCTWTAPTFEVVAATPLKCKHGLREAWCAICKEPHDCVDARGTAKTYKDKTPARNKDKNQQFSRCSECGEPFVDGEGKNTLSQFEFCGETLLTTGECKKAWLDAIVAAKPQTTHKPGQFQTVTLEDVAWCERQSVFPHSRSMPRLLKNFCPHGSVYTTNNHVCRHLATGGSEPCVIENSSYQTHTINGVTAKEFTEKNVVKVQSELRELRFDRPMSVKPEPAKWVVDLVRLGVFSEKALLNGGKRASTQGCTGTEKDGDGLTTDRCTNDRRANAIFDAQQLGSKAHRTPSLCKYKPCSASFVAIRKGHDYHTENCRKRHHEATQGEC